MTEAILDHRQQTENGRDIADAVALGRLLGETDDSVMHAFAEPIALAWLATRAVEALCKARAGACSTEPSKVPPRACIAILRWIEAGDAAGRTEAIAKLERLIGLDPGAAQVFADRVLARAAQLNSETEKGEAA